MRGRKPHVVEPRTGRAGKPDAFAGGRPAKNDGVVCEHLPVLSLSSKIKFGKVDICANRLGCKHGDESNLFTASLTFRQRDSARMITT
jgi:hypothetical protein